MLNTIVTIFKKEWLALFRDRRSFYINLIIGGLLMPIIGVLPSLMMMQSTAASVSSKIQLAVSGLETAPSLQTFFRTSKYAKDFELVPVPDLKTSIENQDFSIGIAIPPNFDQSMGHYQPAEIKIMSASGLRVMDLSSIRVQNLLKDYSNYIVTSRIKENNLPDKFLDTFKTTTQNIELKNQRFQRSYAGWLLAFFIGFFTASAAMSKSVDVSAAEKEKLTLEALLYSPVSRIGIVIGKVLYVISFVVSLVFLNVVSGLAMITVGVFAFIQAAGKELDKTASSAATEPTTTSMVNSPHLASLLLIILLTVILILMFISLQITVGFWSRSETQANTILGLFNLLPIVASLLFLNDSYMPATWHYAIPVIGQFLTYSDLMANHYEALPLLFSFGSGLGFILMTVLLSGWMLNREEILFRT